jgi:hypothetical protein
LNQQDTEALEVPGGVGKLTPETELAAKATLEFHDDEDGIILIQGSYSLS